MSAMPESAGPQRGPIIRTKLIPPRPPRGILKRERLLAALSPGAERMLTLVRAPAGFGKTTLLIAWREVQLSQSAAVAWLTLDEEDSSPERFIACLAAALREGLGADWPQPAWEAHQAPSERDALIDLINALCLCPREVVLILDDYDRIAADGVHELMSFLLTHAPASLHVALGTRSEPPLPLAWLRAHDQLVEVGPAALCFDIDDTRAFFAGMAGLGLAADEIRTLHDAAEGWAAGLRIAALTLRGATERAPQIRAFSGNARAVSDYIAQHILPVAPPAVLDFLLRTAVLERMCAPLCERVAGVRDGQAMLRWLESQNLFLQAQDMQEGWYRYNALFLDFLRARLKERYPDEIAALHSAACDWFAERGSWTEAVRHAVAAGRAPQALDWIEKCADGEVERSRFQPLLEWVAMLPPDAVRQRPRLRIAVAWAQALTMQPDAAQATVTDIERGLHDGAAAPGLTDAMRWELNALRASIAGYADDSAGAYRFARLVLDQPPRPPRPPHDETWRGRSAWVERVARNCLCFHYEKTGNLEAARAVQASASAAPPDSGACLFAAIYRLCLLGACDLKEGRLPDAARRFREALALAELHAGRRSAAAALPAACLAAVHYEWNELDAVEQLLAARLEIMEATSYADAVLLACEMRLRLCLLKQDAAGAHACLDRWESLAAERAWPRVRAACLQERVRLALREGRPADAQAFLQRLADLAGPQAPATPGAQADIHGYLLAARARLMMHERRHEQAAVCLRGAIVMKEKAGALLAAARLRVMLAAALHGAGQHDAAMVSLAGAMSVMAGPRALRSFLDEGEAVTALLAGMPSLPADDGQGAALRDYVAALREAGQAGAPLAMPVRASPPLLSRREQDIMDLVANGLSNKEIARALLITVQTVKWHLKNIYGKLGVSGRMLATSRSRAMHPHPE